MNTTSTAGSDHFCWLGQSVSCSGEDGGPGSVIARRPSRRLLSYARERWKCLQVGRCSWARMEVGMSKWGLGCETVLRKRSLERVELCGFQRRWKVEEQVLGGGEGVWWRTLTEVPEALPGEPSLGQWTWSRSCAWNAEPAA